MDVRQLSEQIQRLVSGANLQDRKIHYREIDLLVGQAAAYKAKAQVMENKNLEGVYYVDGLFVSRFKKVPVLTDSDINVKYSVLPATPINVFTRTGIRVISGMQAQCLPFIPMESTSPGMFGSLEAFNIKGRTYYYIVGDTVNYQGIPGNMKYVYMEIETPAGNFLIPKDWEWDIITQVMQKLGVEEQIPQDKINDGINKG